MLAIGHKIIFCTENGRLILPRRLMVKSKFMLAAIVFIMVFGMYSCVTAGSRSSKLSGAQQAEEASITMELVENDIRLLVLQISTTNSTLQTLVQTEQIDIKKAYADYVATFDAANDTTKRFYSHAEKQNQQVRAYFDHWREQASSYANPDVQLLSEQRLVELSAIYANITEANVGVLGALREYIVTTGEIKKYLSTDLTKKGVDAIAPIARSAIYNGISLKSSLELLFLSTTAFRAELSPLSGQ
jgi:hypothetical protein